MAKRVEAIVEPAILVWARKKSGYATVGEAAAKAGVPAEKLASWEDGVARPTIGQLRKLGKAYRCRIAVFYLSEPPRGFPPIRDYRVVWGARRKTPSPELLAEVEEAHERREIALDLLEEAQERPRSFPLRSQLNEDPEVVAERVRTALRIRVEQQRGWTDDRIGFNEWRSAIESLGVLVFQITTVAGREARGFSIAETRLPVVAANNEDPYVARSFTVVHELAHVTLKESGLCSLGETPRIERFCNHVAGAVLVPAHDLLDHHVVLQHGRDAEWSDNELRRLAATYRVSREVIVRRLLIVGRTNEQFYSAKREEFEEERERRDAALDSQERGWGPSPSTIAVVRAGHLFSRVVLSSYSRGSITGSDVAAYLGVRVKHVPSVERLVFAARR
jgi:Zn-dependent peptidase ImmA (M78 family)